MLTHMAEARVAKQMLAISPHKDNDFYCQDVYPLRDKREISRSPEYP